MEDFLVGLMKINAMLTQRLSNPRLDVYGGGHAHATAHKVVAPRNRATPAASSCPATVDDDTLSCACCDRYGHRRQTSRGSTCNADLANCDGVLTCGSCPRDGESHAECAGPRCGSNCCADS